LRSISFFFYRCKGVLKICRSGSHLGLRKCFFARRKSSSISMDLVEDIPHLRGKCDIIRISEKNKRKKESYERTEEVCLFLRCRCDRR
jgi:hypothetical protein